MQDKENDPSWRSTGTSHRPAGTEASNDVSHASEHVPDVEAVTLRAQLASFRAAFSNITQGVCLFSGSQVLVLCNARYAELYRLSTDQVRPGRTLREIVEFRQAVGTSPMGPDEYLRLTAEINSGKAPRARLSKLPDGRAIRIWNQRMPDGGWVSTHEDVTELVAAHELAAERISLQTLIDLVPDYLWVKDTESRFRVANKALATDAHYLRTSDMIGLSDFQLHPPELAEAFRSIELDIMRSGKAMIDREELVKDHAGESKWVSSTKVPLRNDRNEVVGLVGIARDITARKRASSLQDGQIKLLEQIVADAPLDDILEQLAVLLESQSTELFCSIMVLGSHGGLRCATAPSISEPFLGMAEVLPVDPAGPSCSAAAFRKETVITSDILSDPLWDDHRQVAGAHGFRSCWSRPILSRKGEVLGTIALYSRDVRAPVDAESQLSEFAARLAEVAIERAER